MYQTHKEGELYDHLYQINSVPYTLKSYSEDSANSMNRLVNYSRLGSGKTYVDGELQEYEEIYDETARALILVELKSLSIVVSITLQNNSSDSNCVSFRVKGRAENEKFIFLGSGMFIHSSPSQTFRLNHKLNDCFYPITQLKITLSGNKKQISMKNISIKLNGITDSVMVSKNIQCCEKIMEYRSMKLFVKYFRHPKYSNIYKEMVKFFGQEVENDIVRLLYNSIVENSNFDTAFSIISKCLKNHYFEDYCQRHTYSPQWTMINTDIGNIKNKSPTPRGGHQMCIDSENRTIYLFGGWDGTKELSDLWSYNLLRHEWTLINPEASSKGGPSPRSCHVMVFDSEEKKIYLLGYYLEDTLRTKDNMKSCFYSYDIGRDMWCCLSSDTAAEGGPGLLCGHQMCYDPVNKKIYLFGGKAVRPLSYFLNSSSSMYSGLYTYEVKSNRWEKIMSDLDDEDGGYKIESRDNHIMVLHHEYQRLFIFGGFRAGKFLSDLFYIDTRTFEIVPLFQAESFFHPLSSYTIKGVIDTDDSMIYIFTNAKYKRAVSYHENLKMLTYSISNNTMNLVEFVDSNIKSIGAVVPSTKCGHQMVYDPQKKLCYLFGGNEPNKHGKSTKHLGDIWVLKPTWKIPQEKVARMCRILLISEKFHSLYLISPVLACNYLRANSSVHFDKSDENEYEQLRKLSHSLISSTFDPLIYGLLPGCPDENSGISDKIRIIRCEERLKLFDKLCEFLPDDFTLPKENIVDFLPVVLE